MLNEDIPSCDLIFAAASKAAPIGMACWTVKAIMKALQHFTTTSGTVPYVVFSADLWASFMADPHWASIMEPVVTQEDLSKGKAFFALGALFLSEGFVEPDMRVMTDEKTITFVGTSPEHYCQKWQVVEDIRLF